MEKTKKEQAIKKLQAELKQEKQDEIKRYVPPPLHTQQQRATLCTSACMHRLTCAGWSYRRREIALERKKAAEERQRLEEAKAKVRLSPKIPGHGSPRRRSLPCGSAHARRFPFALGIHLQMGARKAARLRRKMGRTKKINH